MPVSACARSPVPKAMHLQVDFLEHFINHVKYVRSLQPARSRPQLEMCMIVLHVDELSLIHI